MRYGHSDATYAKTIGWLAQACASIQDWGAGMGYARRFVPPGVAYTAVDWAPGAGADITADLTFWRPDPRPDGILLRHVLEHVDDWQQVLDAAVAAAAKRLAVVIFTPFGKETRRLAAGWEIDWSFFKPDLEVRLVGPGLTVTQEHVAGTGTQYDAGEHIFYAERPLVEDRVPGDGQAAGHLVWCRGCGAFWTEPPDPRPYGPDPDDDSCACTCTDDTAPHYEDWYPVLTPEKGHDHGSDGQPGPEQARPVGARYPAAVLRPAQTVRLREEVLDRGRLPGPLRAAPYPLADTVKSHNCCETAVPSSENVTTARIPRRCGTRW
jgi:hypothetical protein